MYRFWGAVNYFFAYKHLMDRPWEDALPEFIPRILAAANELEYVKTIALMGAWLHDSHVGIPRGSNVLRDWVAGEQPPVQVAFIEGRPVVTRVLENDPNGPAVGDEILAVDGQSVAQRIARVAPYGSFSTPWSRDRVLAVWMMAGANGTRASSKRAAKRATTLDYHLASGSEIPAVQQPARLSDVVILLEGNIGYVRSGPARGWRCGRHI